MSQSLASVTSAGDFEGTGNAPRQPLEPRALRLLNRGPLRAPADAIRLTVMLRPKIELPPLRPVLRRIGDEQIGEDRAPTDSVSSGRYRGGRLSSSSQECSGTI
jgi:hypothetical protein